MILFKVGPVVGRSIFRQGRGSIWPAPDVVNDKNCDWYFFVGASAPLGFNEDLRLCAYGILMRRTNTYYSVARESKWVFILSYFSC